MSATSSKSPAKVGASIAADAPRLAAECEAALVAFASLPPDAVTDSVLNAQMRLFYLAEHCVEARFAAARSVAMFRTGRFRDWEYMEPMHAARCRLDAVESGLPEIRAALGVAAPAAEAA